MKIVTYLGSWLVVSIFVTLFQPPDWRLHFCAGAQVSGQWLRTLHRFWWPSRIGSVGHSHGVGAQHGDGHLSRSTNQWSGLPLHGDLLSCWSWVLGCGCHWLFSLVGAYSKHKMTRLLSISSLKHSFGFIISNKTGQCNKLNWAGWCFKRIFPIESVPITGHNLPAPRCRWFWWHSIPSSPAIPGLPPWSALRWRKIPCWRWGGRLVLVGSGEIQLGQLENPPSA